MVTASTTTHLVGLHLSSTEELQFRQR